MPNRVTNRTAPSRSRSIVSDSAAESARPVLEAACVDDDAARRQLEAEASLCQGIACVDERERPTDDERGQMLDDGALEEGHEAGDAQLPTVAGGAADALGADGGGD